MKLFFYVTTCVVATFLATADAYELCDPKAPESHGIIAHGVHNMPREVAEWITGKEIVQEYPMIGKSPDFSIKLADYDLDQSIPSMLGKVLNQATEEFLNGKKTDHNYQLADEIVHSMHMLDTWNKTREAFKIMEADGKFDLNKCKCLRDYQNNGILDALKVLRFILKHNQSTGCSDHNSWEYDSANIYNYALSKIVEGNITGFNPESASDEEKCALLQHERSGMSHVANNWTAWKRSFTHNHKMVDNSFPLFLYCLTQSPDNHGTG